MQRLILVAMVLFGAAWQAAAFPCSPADRSSCPVPPGSPALRQDQIPQFITMTWDDGVTPQAYSLIQNIVSGLKQRNGCGIPSTFFVTVANSIPAAVQALYLQGNEIATHTVTHPSYPSAEEIVGCRDWLVNNTGIPAEKMLGFRAPFLLSDAAMRQTLSDNGFLYDSSIADQVPSQVSPSQGEQTWPYQLTNGIPQNCSTGGCSATESYPGLWEIPLWSVADAQQQPIASMDPEGNAYDNYKRELEWRLAGNRAPLGLFFHAGLESDPTRVQELRQFIQYAASLPDVWFVTNQQMLAWMQNPVPASRVSLSLKCEAPTDISPDVGSVCATYVGDCQFGSFDSTQCKCVCMGEGSPGGYCPDPQTGECTALC
ncbi:hypothetical protein ABPG77_003991 [Micractinium sp. CCAP 211/92]